METTASDSTCHLGLGCWVSSSDTGTYLADIEEQLRIERQAFCRTMHTVCKRAMQEYYRRIEYKQRNARVILKTIDFKRGVIFRR